jgi:hypothetical protein
MSVCFMLGRKNYVTYLCSETGSNTVILCDFSWFQKTIRLINKTSLEKELVCVSSIRKSLKNRKKHDFSTAVQVSKLKTWYHQVPNSGVFLIKCSKNISNQSSLVLNVEGCSRAARRRVTPKWVTRVESQSDSSWLQLWLSSHSLLKVGFW